MLVLAPKQRFLVGFAAATSLTQVINILGTRQCARIIIAASAPAIITKTTAALAAPAQRFITLNSTAGLAPGMPVSGDVSLPMGCTITSIESPTRIQISANVLAGAGIAAGVTLSFNMAAARNTTAPAAAAQKAVTVGSTAGLIIGMPVTCADADIGAGNYIASVDSATQFSLTNDIGGDGILSGVTLTFGGHNSADMTTIAANGLWNSADATKLVAAGQGNALDPNPVTHTVDLESDPEKAHYIEIMPNLASGTGAKYTIPFPGVAVSFLMTTGVFVQFDVWVECEDRLLGDRMKITTMPLTEGGA